MEKNKNHKYETNIKYKIHFCLHVSTETIKRVLKDYHSRINQLEDEKFDLEYAVKKKDFEVEKNKEEIKFSIKL